MKPILIITQVACEQSGYLCNYLDKQAVNYKNISIENCAVIPENTKNFSGIILLGSSYSVNDSYAWISDEVSLIKQAIQQDLPILGICFGAQILSKALGGDVYHAKNMQIGWYPVTLTQQGRTILDYTGFADDFLVFEWHSDTFSLPWGAIPLFTGECIEQHGFIFRKSLALQFHPEITKDIIYEWVERYAHCFEKPAPCIQSKNEILKDVECRLKAQRNIANLLFGWWLDKVRIRSS